MGWRDKLQKASFRGVHFWVDSSDYEVGRKNIFHEFPYRDDAELEDQGKAAESFSITGHILQYKTGNDPNDYDYFAARDAFIEALNSPGAGKLVHPYYGDKNVALDGRPRITETFQEGGIARITMQFREVSTKETPTQILDPTKFMDDVALDTLEKNLDIFDKVMNVGADLNKMAADVNKAMQGAIAGVRDLKNMPGSVISTATGLILSATALANASLNYPCDLANAIVGGFDSFLFAAGMLDDVVSRDIFGSCSGRTQNPEEAERLSDVLTVAQGLGLINSCSKSVVFGSDLPAINVVSASSAANQANRQALINLVRATALLNACRIAVRVQYDSQDAAKGVLLQITKLIANFLEYLGDEAGDDTLSAQGVAFNNDDVYQSIQQLTPALKKSMDIIGANLAPIISYDVGYEIQSVLTLAYDKYEDLDRAQEIIDRNALAILNPCFCPNGKAINILSE